MTWMAGVLIPVTCGVGMAWITQLAFTEAHSRFRLVLGGKPVPVTVIFAPTMAAVGETVIEGDAVAALAEPANRKTQRRAAVPAMKILVALGLPEGHLEAFMAIAAGLPTINALTILKSESSWRESRR
jgi:hypothetical protein